MTSLGKHFEIADEKLKALSKYTFKGVNYRITVLTDRLIRFEYSLDGNFYDGATEQVHNRRFEIEPKIKVEQDQNYLVITSKYFIMQYAKEKPFKGPSFAPDSNLKVKLVNTDKIWYPNHPEARNFKGSAYSIEDFLDKTVLSNGLYSTDGFALLDDSKTMIINKDGYLKLNENKRNDFYLFIYRRDFGLCLKDYFTLTGYPPLIPRYALGIWWNRDLIYNEEDIHKLLYAFNKHEIPLSVLLLSEFWHNKDKSNYNLYKSGFTFNNELFPDPARLTNYLHDNNVRIGLNIDGSEGITPLDDAYLKMKEELKEESEIIPFKVLDKEFIDSYFENLINPLYNLGIDFFWIDTKDEAITRVLNYYHFNDYKKFKDKRGIILSRNGGKSAHLYPIHYSGETKVGWSTLKYLPYFNSSASNIGLSWWSHDVGGFKNGIEDNELYLRYIELSTFSGIFRFSARRGDFYKREPWRWDMVTYTIVKNYCKLRHRLIPYLYTEGYNYHKNCLPVIEPLYYYYPELIDESAYKNEYYFGTELLVSPITKPKDKVMNRAVEKIFLPSGTWYDFKTGKKYMGNKRYISFFKDEDYPVFAKAGAIIPLAVIDDNDLNNTNNPKGLEIDIFPGASNVYKLYEDDGISSKYENKDYIFSSIEYTYASDGYTLNIHKDEGNIDLIPQRRDYIIRFKNTRKPEKVMVEANGEKLKDITSYIDDNDFIIKIDNVDVTRPLIVNCVGNNIEIDAVRIINEDIFEIISDLKIETLLKEKIAAVIFSDLPINKKRIAVRKLKKAGLQDIFIKMFIKLLEYVEEI